LAQSVTTTDDELRERFVTALGLTAKNCFQLWSHFPSVWASYWHNVRI